MGWAMLFLVLALVAGLFGFTRVCGRTFHAARMLFAACIVVFLAIVLYTLIHQA